MFHVLQLVYLMLPVYVANMAAPFARHWRGWNRPISARWLGEHKTVVGFTLGVVAAILTTFVQTELAWQGALISYDHWFPLGLACGVAALGGDSAKSFIKRRIGIAPGSPWIPADQLDFVVGGLLALTMWIPLSFTDVLTILVVSFVGDIAVNHAAFRLHIRDTRW